MKFPVLSRIRATALVLAVFASVLVPLAAAPDAGAQQRCPAVAVIAARGSGQNQHIAPTSYSPQAPWVSNGWEAETIRAFLQHAEQRYRSTHGGASLMSDVEVLGLEPRYYPAAQPESGLPAAAAPASSIQGVRLALEHSLPVLQMAPRAGAEFAQSLRVGRAGVMQQVDDYEAATGCRPSYVLIGFSQGAMILLEHERALARRGQLAGVVYFGNPNTAPGDPSTVGVPGGGAGGMLGQLPFNSRTAAATPNRVNYCLPLDLVCDLSGKNAKAAAGAGGGNHGLYYLAPFEWDNQVSDSFGRFVDQVRYQ